MSARQATARPGAAPLEHPHHAVAGDAGFYRQAQIPEIVRHDPGGALLLVRELRVLMKLPAPGATSSVARSRARALISSNNCLISALYRGPGGSGKGISDGRGRLNGGHAGSRGHVPACLIWGQLFGNPANPTLNGQMFTSGRKSTDFAVIGERGPAEIPGIAG